MSLALADSAVSLPAGRSVDELLSPEDATRWLVDHDLVPGRTELLMYCQQQLTDLREQVRSLFDALVQGDSPPERALGAVNRALARVPSSLVLRHDPATGFRQESAHPVTQLVEHAMARISADAAELLTGDEASQLARCEASPCDRFFLRTHARRQWCCTRCGDRVRAARAYARSQAQRAGS